MSSGIERQLTWDGRGGGTLSRVDGAGGGGGGDCAGGDGAGRDLAGEGRACVAISGEKCVHCGACTSICSSGALTMDAPAWTLAFHSNRCNACRRCVGACPVGAISAGGSSG